MSRAWVNWGPGFLLRFYSRLTKDQPDKYYQIRSVNIPLFPTPTPYLSPKDVFFFPVPSRTSPIFPNHPIHPHSFRLPLAYNPTNASSNVPSAITLCLVTYHLFHPDRTHRPYPLTTSALFVPYDQSCHRTCLCALIRLPYPRALLQ